jgi:hypothetical protein
VVLRTFMPDAGSRALAVGFPGGISAAFDAHTCRLAYGWSGEFLDAAPIWADRGGNPAKVLGARFWTAPPGCPVGATSRPDPPDFAARANDPAYGAPIPEGKVFQETMRLQFLGYAMDKKGMPTFRYRLEADSGAGLAVEERVAALRCTVATGVSRHFRVMTPAQQTLWLLAGESKKPPGLLDAKGSLSSLDLKGGKADVAVTGEMLVLPQENGRPIVMALAAAPKGSSWRVQRGGDGWQVLLHVPASSHATTIPIDINLWAPYRDDPGLLKELVSVK